VQDRNNNLAPIQTNNLLLELPNQSDRMAKTMHGTSSTAKWQYPALCATGVVLAAGAHPLMYLKSAMVHVLAVCSAAAHCAVATPLLVVAAGAVLLSLALLCYILFPSKRHVYVLDFAVHKPHTK
jgi:hypothetical protein